VNNLNKTPTQSHVTAHPIERKDEEPIFKPKANNFALRDALQSAMNINLGDVGSVTSGGKKDAEEKINSKAEESNAVASNIKINTKGAPDELLEKIMNLEEE
jgi:hypothetical protein